ncbi:uncharacterized protein [Nicotiana tomentosiformis]|uniref:uncharacterized protein n=1 Tax=Nicotiana tomentosiformis TaxID=4098 RepID=UPI00388CDA60
MAKTSKIVPQKEVASSSQPTGDEAAAEPRPEEFVPAGCPTVTDFRVEKASLVVGRCLGKDVAMRPPSGDEEVLPPTLKQAKEKKRKGAPSSSGSEKKKPARKSRKPKGDIGVMPSKLISQLRNELEEGKENGVAPVLCRCWTSKLCGLGKNVAMRPPSGDEEFLPPTPKQAKEKKRKGAPSSPGSEKKKPARKSRKPKGDIGVMPSKLISRLRNEPKEGEEEDNSQLVARASVFHHEAFHRIREEHEVEVRQRLEQIGRLNLQVDAIQAEVEKFKKNMDILASQKETVQVQLESAETQLQAAKEKALVELEKINELQSQLDLTVSDKASLANELKVARSKVTVARSEVVVANTNADAKVAQFRVEAIQAKAKGMVDHAKWQAQRESLEGVNAQGFDIMARIENTKAEEARARRLAFPEEDSESSSETDDGEDPEDGDATSDEDQAT